MKKCFFIPLKVSFFFKDNKKFWIKKKECKKPIISTWVQSCVIWIFHWVQDCNLLTSRKHNVNPVINYQPGKTNDAYRHSLERSAVRNGEKVHLIRGPIENHEDFYVPAICSTSSINCMLCVYMYVFTMHEYQVQGYSPPYFNIVLP